MPSNRTRLLDLLAKDAIISSMDLHGPPINQVALLGSREGQPFQIVFHGGGKHEQPD